MAHLSTRAKPLRCTAGRFLLSRLHRLGRDRHTMTLHFCTFFDHRYLSRALVLYDSLAEHGQDFRLHVISLTAECSDALASLDPAFMSVTDIAELERQVPELKAAKADRSLVSYYFTLKSVWLKRVLDLNPDIGIVTYVDADMRFFADPGLAVGQIEGHSVTLTPHRFPPALSNRLKFGTFNAGWISFRRDEAGLACLDWWRSSCLKWCDDKVAEDGRFADQGYLNDMPERFDGVKVMTHPGINLAPWNLSASRLSADRSNGAPATQVDGEPLVLFHFHGLTGPLCGFYFPNLTSYGTSLTPLVRRHIYGPYISALQRSEGRLEGLRTSSPPPGRGKQRNSVSFKKLLEMVLKRDLLYGGVQ